MSKLMESERRSHDPQFRDRSGIDTMPAKTRTIAVLLERAALDDEPRFAFVVGQNAHLIVVKMAVAHDQQPAVEANARTVTTGHLGT